MRIPEDSVFNSVPKSLSIRCAQEMYTPTQPRIPDPTQQAVTPGTDITRIRTIKRITFCSLIFLTKTQHNVCTVHPPALSRRSLSNSSQTCSQPGGSYPGLPAPMSLRGHPSSRFADAELYCGRRLELLQEAITVFDSCVPGSGPVVQ